MSFHLTEFTTQESFVDAAVAKIVGILKENIQKKAWASLVLSGGNTPKLVYAKLAEVSDVDWSKVYLFFGDERYVPSNDQQSNFAMAQNYLLSKISVPEAHIFRVKTELSFEDCVLDYEQQIQQFFETHNHAVIQFDLVLLGLGEDGHIASLFPNTPALDEQKSLVSENVTTTLAVRERITLTYPALESAAKTLFLLTGSGKKAVLLQSGSTSDFKQYPAARILARDNVDVLGFFH